jgi:hypothetical protein
VSMLGRAILVIGGFKGSRFSFFEAWLYYPRLSSAPTWI